ncbi:MAG: ABC transporter permease [Proteobacteria bacterium]|nr:ABC transporter permease [Pseudomonadota bacterium]
MLSGSGKLALLILLLMAGVALAAPLLCRHSHRIASGPALAAPSLVHPMGTDELGVDLWAQIAYGARISLLVGAATALLAGVGGAAVGIVSGYQGGLADRLTMRLIDILLVLPDLPVMIVLAAFFGPSVTTIIVVLAAFSWTATARIIRSRVLILKERRYIKAAELYGAGTLYLLRRHFLPEIFPLAAVGMIRLAGRAIVAEAGLSFLGLGDPTSRSWGLIMHHALSFKGIYYTDFWKWWLVFPWLALTLVVTSLALLGRDLEKLADPRIGRS